MCIAGRCRGVFALSRLERRAIVVVGALLRLDRRLPAVKGTADGARSACPGVDVLRLARLVRNCPLKESESGRLSRELPVTLGCD